MSHPNPCCAKKTFSLSLQFPTASFVSGAYLHGIVQHQAISEECPTQCLCHKGLEPLEKHSVSPRHEGLVPHYQWPSKKWHPTAATCCEFASGFKLQTASNLLASTLSNAKSSNIQCKEKLPKTTLAAHCTPRLSLSNEARVTKVISKSRCSSMLARTWYIQNMVDRSALGIGIRWLPSMKSVCYIYIWLYIYIYLYFQISASSLKRMDSVSPSHESVSFSPTWNIREFNESKLPSITAIGPLLVLDSFL